MDEAKAKMAEVSAEGDETSSGLGSIAKGGLIVAAAAIVAVGALAVDLGSKYIDSTDKLAASANITVAQATRIGQAFTGQAFSTTVSAQTTMTAYQGVAAQLGQTAGHALTSAQALGVMTASQDLAEASGESLSATTADTANVLQLYHLNMGQASNATDVLFNSARLTGQSVDSAEAAIQKMKAGLGVLAPSLGQTGGLLVDLQDHGETGKKGLAAVTGAMTTLTSGTPAETKALTDAGVAIKDSSGKYLSMSTIIGELHDKTAGMTAVQAKNYEGLVIGATNADKLYSTIAAGKGVLDADTDAVTKTGSAHTAAGIASDNLEGNTKKLEAGFTDIITNIGIGLVPILNKLLLGVFAVAGGVVALTGFLGQHKTALAVVGAVILTVLAPALIMFVAGLVASGVAAVAAGAVAVASFVASSVAAVASSVVSIAAFVATAAGALAAGIAMAAAFLLPLAPFILIGVAAIALVALIVTHWSQIKSFVSGLVSDVVGFFEKIPAEVGTVVSKVVAFFDSIVTGVSTDIGKVIAFFTGLPAKILSGLGSLAGLLLGAGGDLISGLIKGITGAVGGAIKAVTGVASSVVGAVKGVLGVLSPSTVFADIGTNLGLGLAAGITGSSAGVTAAAKGMASAAVVPVAPMVAGVGALAAQSASSAAGGGGTAGQQPITVTYNIPVTGDVSPATVALLKTMFQQHDQELVTTLSAMRA